MILHRFYFNLKQSDKKSDKPGILGPGRPLMPRLYLQLTFGTELLHLVLKCGAQINFADSFSVLCSLSLSLLILNFHIFTIMNIEGAK